MALSISKQNNTNPKLLSLSFRSLIIYLFLLAGGIQSIQSYTCPNSIPSSSATIKELCSFSTFSSTFTYRTVEGPMSSNAYYLYQLASSNTAIRKVDSLGSEIWLDSFIFKPIMKSFAVDSTEQFVYLASLNSPLEVLRLSAENGVIINLNKL